MNKQGHDAALPHVDGDESDHHPESSGLSAVDSMDNTKHVQLVETLKWLCDNYERSDGVCLPRCVLYTHYLDFCKKHEFFPSSAATFGKVIRQKFPKLTTRRLGTRGQSKYHYYGISIKKESIYYHSVYSGPGLTRFSEKKPERDVSNKKFSLSSKSGTLLPPYPEANNLVLPEEVTCEKVEIFILMYRTHSQRLLDVIVSNNFDEVQNFLLHFWQGLPPHLSSLLTYDVIVDVIILCDSVLYKVLTDILIPAAIQDIPESLSNEIRVFARKLPVWLEMSLDQIPNAVKQKKMKVVRAFVQSLRRQMSFIQLAQTARAVLLSHESITEMMADLKEVKTLTSFHQAGLTEDLKTSSKQLMSEFEALMNKQAPLESFIEWIDCIIDDRLLKPFESEVDPAQFNSRASEFLMNWSFITGKLMAEFTMRSLKSFGKFHLLNLMLQEYALLAIETQHDKAVHIGYQRNVQQHMRETATISTKAMVRSTNRKIGTGPTHKAKKRRPSSMNMQVAAEAPSHSPNSQRFHMPLDDTESTNSNPSQDSRKRVGEESLQSFPSSHPSGQEGIHLSSSGCMPLYHGLSGNSYNSDPNGAQETSYSTSYLRQSQSSDLPQNEYAAPHGVSFPVGAFNCPQNTFPHAMLASHLPVPPTWSGPSNAPGYGVYAELQNSSSVYACANTGSMPNFISHDQTRDFRNVNFPTGHAGQSHFEDRAGKYTSRGMVPHRNDPAEGLSRGLACPSDHLPTYHYGI